MDLSISSTKMTENVSATLDEIARGADDAAGAETNAAGAPGSVGEAPHTDAANTLVRGGFVERVLGETLPTVATAPAQVHAEQVDKSPETANIQTFARPPAPAEPAKPLDHAVPTNLHARRDDAVPVSLLAPASLLGLQVEHATIWPMTARGFDPDQRPVYESRVHPREQPPSHDDRPPEEHDEDVAADAGTGEHKPDDTQCGTVFEAEPDATWCAAITRALHIALAARVPPRALVLAAAEWRRGRCVLLACPQGADRAGAAWAFVLWPRKLPGESADSAPAYTLFGLRVDARLQWSTLPGDMRWWHVRVIKEHHPRTGRQLITATAEPSSRVPCEVQLGPVLARPLRCCDVCVRIGAARRFWTALGSQWSMHVVVSALPLLDDGDVVEDVSR
jgi:hypothetical protein